MEIQQKPAHVVKFVANLTQLLHHLSLNGDLHHTLRILLRRAAARKLLSKCLGGSFNINICIVLDAILKRYQTARDQRL